MSFLNPVNEPVLLFKSTDAGAPQINYNARTAGDVKAVLKACLVTGYGSTASAGWSIVNEVGHVCEFISPSAAMSDYRLGIDDNSAANTTWYYQYQNARVNPTKNLAPKSVNYVDKPATEWLLFVSARGLYFVESFLHTSSSSRVQRVVWIGQLKSALLTEVGINMSFFQTGYASENPSPTDIFTNSTLNRHSRVGAYQNLNFETANLAFFKDLNTAPGISAIDLVSDIYLSSGTTIIAAQPGLQTLAPADVRRLSSGASGSDRYLLLMGRGVNGADMPMYNKPFLLATDSWEY